MSLRDLGLKFNYFSGEDDIIDDFYIPVLKETKYYDRMASFFSSSSLTTASLGFKELIENDGHVRLLVNTHLDEKDVEVLKGKRETPTKNIKEMLDPENAKNREEEIRWQILAWMLDNDCLEIRICDVPQNGLFHPKIGILKDENEDIVVFSGSANESKQAWERNIEDIDVYRSWKEGHMDFVEPKVRRFEQIWKNELGPTETYKVPDAIKNDIIKARAPDFEKIKERSKELPEHTNKIDQIHIDDWIKIIHDAGKTIGGTHLAEMVSSIEPWPHQRIISDTLYSTYPKGFLLCDEVGLGKTIEAGLTLSRLINTEEIQNSLILAPANLVQQWQEELSEKFNLTTYRYEKPKSEQDYKMIDENGKIHDIPDFSNGFAWSESPVWRFVHKRNENEEPVIVLASWHLARMKDNQEIFVPNNPEKGKVRKKDDLKAGCRGRDKSEREGVWDLVFVDEAHKARRRKFRTIQQRNSKGTPNNLLKLLRNLQSYTQCMHLLTATPMQINSIELYDLLSLVGLPAEWDDTKEFLDFYNIKKAVQDEINNETISYTGQSKLKDGKQIKQSKLGADDFINKIGTRLDYDRGKTINYLLKACRLVRAYDREQNGVYTSELEDEIKHSSNRRYLQHLIRDESQYSGFTSNKEKEMAIEKISLDEWKLILEAFKEANPVEVILNRYTRETLREYEKEGLLEETVPKRKVTKKMIKLGKATSVYDDIENYVQDFYRKAMKGDDERSRSVGIVMTTYRQRMTSSFYAIRKSLTNRLRVLKRTKDRIEKEEDLDVKRTREEQYYSNRFRSISSEDVEDFIDSTDESEFDSFDLKLLPENLERYSNLLEKEINALGNFISEVKDLSGDRDPKLEQLRNDIKNVNKKGRDRVMVFTQFTDTLDAIRDSLVSNYGKLVGCYSGRGGEMFIDGNWKQVGKEKVKNEFNSDEGNIDILICTEAASHGLNLQRCGVLINYDLPWNPMRVEQRIGRIDRIGQKYDEVWIYNYFYEDSVETDIYKKLEDRVNIFHEYVGGMQPILSTISDQIRKAAMEGGTEELKEEKKDEHYDYLSDEINKVERDRLNGWDDYKHPDIGEVKVNPLYPYEAPLSNEKIEESLLNNKTLENEGIKFVETKNLDNENIYLLEIEDKTNEILECASECYSEPKEDTIADKIISNSKDNYQFAVTFNPCVSEKYPSLRLFSYGDCLFRKIIDNLDKKCKLSKSLQHICLDSQGDKTDKDDWVVCGWYNEEIDDSLNFVVDKSDLKKWINTRNKLLKLINS